MSLAAAHPILGCQAGLQVVIIRFQRYRLQVETHWEPLIMIADTKLKFSTVISVLTRRFFRRIFARHVESGWIACENAMIYEARAVEYEKRGNHEQAAWQRGEAERIRKAFRQHSSQWR